MDDFCLIFDLALFLKNDKYLITVQLDWKEFSSR